MRSFSGARTTSVALVLLSSIALTTEGQERTDSAATSRSAVVSEPWSLKTGDRVRGATTGGRRFDGSVASQTGSAFVVGRAQSSWFALRLIALAAPPPDLKPVSYADLARLEVRRPPKRRGVALTVGILAGAAAGGLLAARSVHNECEGSGSFGPCIDRSEAAIFGGGLGALGGAAVAVLLTPSRWRTLPVRAITTPEAK